MTTKTSYSSPIVSDSPSPRYETIPSIDCDGTSVDTRSCIEPGTSAHVAWGYVAMVIGLLIGGVFSYGLLWLVLLLTPLIDLFNRKKQIALLRGSGLEVGPHQFPEIYQCAVTQARRLGMDAPPAIYIVEGNMINAAAAKIGGRKVIVLIDDIVDACLRSGEPRALAFILGHEMAHHALGHSGLIRATLGKYNKKLSRLDEFSCDSVAHQLVGNPDIAAVALTTLLTGPQLLKFVNLHQLFTQASEVAKDKNSVKAERQLSHPLMLRRIQRFHQL